MRLFLLLLGMIILFNPVGFAATEKAKKTKAVTKKAPVTKTTKPKVLTKKVNVVRYYDSSQLTVELRRILNSMQLDADISIYVKSMQQGKVLYAQNIHREFVPASISKIFTAEAALLYLGPHYSFATQLYTDAKTIRGGVLQGNLYVVLSGDPSLQYEELIDLFSNLKKRQISTISGNVYIDDTAYDKSFYGPGWIWKDRNYCYAAPIGAGIVNRNCLSFAVAPARSTGRYAEVLRSDKYFYPTIRNSVITKNVKKTACYLRLTNESTTTISLEGCMPLGREKWGVSYVINDIPEYNRALVKSLLGKLNVRTLGQVTFGEKTYRAALLDSHYSRPLRELVSEMLKKSDNVIAGAIFKKLGQIYMRQRGSWENGSYAVSQILSRRAGVNTTGLRVVDGSGLSRHNVATSAQFMQVLDFAYHHKGTSEEFIAALPISGIDGTLKHRLENVTRKVRAKTGTMSGVVSLAGYALNANNQALAFVIMVNGRNGLGWRYKELEDKIVTTLARHTAG